MSWGNLARRIHNVGIVGCSALLVVCAQLAAAQEMWLVTPEEAALAPAPEDSLIRSRGLTSKGPRIDVLKPASDAPQQSPIEILIHFHPKSAPVRLESVKVQLVKFISIDITDRVKPYLSETGIEMKEAKIPSGAYLVRISVADEKGESSTRELELEVK